MGRERKKVVFLLFEGRSDYDALFIPISRMYEDIDESIEILYGIIDEGPNGEGRRGGDITSRFGVHPSKIQEEISKLMIKPVLKSEGVYPKDLKEIIHFVDMDGVYIPDECVVQSPEGATHINYLNDSIETNNVEGIQRRNFYKRENLDFLSGLGETKVESKTIKYSVYYSSCNLDHVVTGENNVDLSAKRAHAEHFQIRDAATTELFKAFFDKLLPDVEDIDYAKSWEYIKKDTNSLKRCSNIGVLVNRLLEE